MNRKFVPKFSRKACNLSVIRLMGVADWEPISATQSLL
jgi:hypothetical protein